MAATAADYGWIGAVERDASRAYTAEGLTETAAAKLEKIANRMLGVGKGRPNKHAPRLLRARRPEQERLMPYGLELMHRPTESY